MVSCNSSSATGFDALLGQFNTALSLTSTLGVPSPPPAERARILKGLRARQVQNSAPPTGPPPPVPVLMRLDDLSLDALVQSSSATPTKVDETPKSDRVPALLAAAFVVEVAAVDEQTVHLDETVHHEEETVHQEDTEVPEIPLPDLDMPFLFEMEGPKRRRSSISLSPRPSKVAKTE